MASSSSAAAPSGSPSDLSLLIKAPSKDAVFLFFTACFQHRHALSPAPLAASAAALLSLPGEEASRVALAGSDLLRHVLYESSELQSVDAVKALLPRGLDARLEGLLGTVRFFFNCLGGRARRRTCVRSFR